MRLILIDRYKYPIYMDEAIWDRVEIERASQVDRTLRDTIRFELN